MVNFSAPLKTCKPDIGEPELGELLYYTLTLRTNQHYMKTLRKLEKSPHLGWRFCCGKPVAQCGLNAVLKLKYQTEKPKVKLTSVKNAFFLQGSLKLS